jgi:hypothetical protein
MEPVAEPLDLPPEYGTVTEIRQWSAVREELEQARYYWLATVRPDGRPHAVPLDGIWMDDVWYYGGSDQAVHYRNVAERPEAVMHVGDGLQAIIVEGEVRPARPSKALARRLATASRAKYGYAPPVSSYAGALGLFPRRVLAWTALPRDATRFRFDAS